mmetsp:Transcript_54493/g.70036  ORF Transcript_54493/g.70036 Transcript_54493/m.70036 type:complete len:348 (+) Transcript_54493:389-1432(+)
MNILQRNIKTIDERRKRHPLKKNLQRLQQHLQHLRKKKEHVKSSLMDNPTSSRLPLVLVLDEQLQRFPVESMACLASKEVSRIPSLSYLILHACIIKQQQQQTSLSTSASTSSTSSSSSIATCEKVSYIIDPEDNLPRTQATLKPIFTQLHKQFGWEGMIGQIPTEEKFRDMLLTQDLFIYCGHGSGERFLRREIVESLPLNLSSTSSTTTSLLSSFAILMGCSSGYLHPYGEYEPNGYVQALLLSGKTCIVANLWDVTDKDIDKFTEKLLTNLTTSSSISTSSGSTSASEGGTDDKINKNRGAKSLSLIVSESRHVCKLLGLSGAAPVCYGVPLKCFVPRPRKPNH